MKEISLFYSRVIFEPKDVIGKNFIRESGKPIPKCEVFEENQEFIVDEMLTVPEGFSPNAWFGIYRELSILLMGNGFPDWTGENTIYGTCPDGIRPVCFKIEKQE